MMKKIAVVTTTRADYGILKPLIQKLIKVPQFETCLLVTGTHLERALGETIKEIQTDNFPIYWKKKILEPGDTPLDSSKAVANALRFFAEHFQQERIEGKPYDLVIVLGDRTEMLGICLACLNEGIPIAHLHGGERSEGVVDEQIRHSITKMSYLHFPATKEYGKRIHQLGEQEDRIFVVGALGVENVLHAKLLKEQEIRKYLNLNEEQSYCVVTYHPITLPGECVEAQAAGLIQFIRKHTEVQFIITKANSDVGGRKMNQLFEELDHQLDHVHLVSSLGMERYLSAVRYAIAVIGNSSSGIIEVPAFHVPVINIGNRQKGRISSSSVIHTDESYSEIEKAYKLICQKEVLFEDSPYGDGNTSDRIVEILKKELLEKKKTTEKQFYDMNWEEEY